MAETAPILQIARCDRCQGYSYPPNVPGCRHCGAPPADLSLVACVKPLPLRNFVTVHAELVPGLRPPYVIGEVEIAPGLFEEVMLTVEDEAVLQVGMPVAPEWSESAGWRFRPLAQGEPA